jgi:hypothetical protein
VARRLAFRSAASFVACGCRCSPGLAGRIGGRIVTERLDPFDALLRALPLTRSDFGWGGRAWTAPILPRRFDPDSMDWVRERES